MKRFTFNMEKILKIKKFEENECKLAFGQAVGILNGIENEIKITAIRRHNAVEQRFITPADMASWDNYVLRLEQEAERLAQKAAKAELVVEEKRALYMEAQKEVKAIEKLKEKKQKEYRKDMMNYQMAEVDDMTSARYGREEIYDEDYEQVARQEG